MQRDYSETEEGYRQKIHRMLGLKNPERTDTLTNSFTKEITHHLFEARYFELNKDEQIDVLQERQVKAILKTNPKLGCDLLNQLTETHPKTRRTLLKAYEKATDLSLFQLDSNAKIILSEQAKATYSAATPAHQQMFFATKNTQESYREAIHRKLGLKIPNKTDEATNAFTEALSNILLEVKFFSVETNKVQALLNLQHNPSFQKLLDSHWEMACKFLDMATENNQRAKQQILEQPLYQAMYDYNRLKDETIPQALRADMSIETQQRIVRGVKAQEQEEQAASKKSDNEGFRTQAINKLDIQAGIEIPPDLICPLTTKMFNDPVKYFDPELKFTYVFERTAITEWLAIKKINPISQKPLTLAMLKEAPDVKSRVEAFKADMTKGEKKAEIEQIMRDLEKQPKMRGPRST